MSAINTTRADVLWNGAKIAKIRDINWNINNGLLNDTGIGEKNATSKYGLRTTSGTGTLFYDPQDSPTVSILNRALSDSETTDALVLKTDRTSAQGVMSGQVLLGSLAMGVPVGDLVSVQVQFTVSGGNTGAF
jgi:hypothetical protein